jgi:hypothetical protein
LKCLFPLDTTFWPPVDCILCLIFVCLHAEMVLFVRTSFF